MSDPITPELVRHAIDTTVRYQFATVSTLQRKVGVGFVTAGRLMDELERLGVVGPHVGSFAREVRYPASKLDQALALAPRQQ